jgi:hypothetical protein
VRPVFWMPFLARCSRTVLRLSATELTLSFCSSGATRCAAALAASGNPRPIKRLAHIQVDGLDSRCVKFGLVSVLIVISRSFCRPFASPQAIFGDKGLDGIKLRFCPRECELKRFPSDLNRRDSQRVKYEPVFVH